MHLFAIRDEHHPVVNLATVESFERNASSIVFTFSQHTVRWDYAQEEDAIHAFYLLRNSVQSIQAAK